MSEASGAVEKARNPSIDWMKAVSILYITGFWHLLGYTDYGSATQVVPFYQITVAALSLFVFLSGYLIGRTVVPLTAAGLTAFYRKRLLRIYPPYPLAIVLFGLLGLSKATTLIKAAALVSMVYGPPPWTLWFITMIFAFYVVTPVLTNLRPRPGMLAAVAVGGWLLFAAGWALTDRFDIRPLLYWPSYVLGFALSGRKLPLPGRISWMLVAAAAAFVLSLLATGAGDISLWSAPLAWVSAPLIFFLANGRLPQSRLVGFVAAGGFFLYLFHRPVYVTALELAELQDGGPLTLAILLAAWALLIPVSSLAEKAYGRAVSRLR